MTRHNNKTQETAPSPWLALFVLTLFIAVMVVMYCSALETPSGDGVPGSAEWAQTGP